MSKKKIRVSSITTDSIVNGPGLRYVLWVQGCSLQCKGCHNSHTWNTHDGYEATVDYLMNYFEKNNAGAYDGLTVSGGEPLDQWESVKELIIRFKDKFPKSSIWLYTGYELEDIMKRFKNEPMELVEIETLVIGRYEKESPKHKSWAGSENQLILQRIGEDVFSVG